VSITGKILSVFCLVALVSLGSGLWSLHVSTHLHDLNHQLVTRELPAARLQLVLAEQVPALVRHASYAVVLRDPAYEALHREKAQEFQSGLQRLTELVEGAEAREALAQVQARFLTYLERADLQWAAAATGRADEARHLAEGPTRQASETLLAALGTLRTRTQAQLEHTTTTTASLARRAHVATWLGFAVLLVLAIGVAFLAAIQVARPIRILSRAARRVARGEYDVPVVRRSRDEVGDLARSFRRMADQLRELDGLKQEFFYSVSHEFRSPLMSISMAASLLQETGELSPHQQRWLEIIRQDGEKLARLTTQILDLAKIRSGSLQLQWTTVDVRWIVESAVKELQPLAEKKGLTLTLTIPVPPPRVVCDEARIQQVLTNLLSNAIKFTPTGGRIHVTARERGLDLIVTVEDTGVGIPPGERERVFERYHQAPRTRGGTGLGLSIVRAFVEAHGGRVWVDSREGEGSRFHFTLPRRRAAGRVSGSAIVGDLLEDAGESARASRN
jgi:signal transduction histidine kinase